jgi:hypothetical protein
VPNKHQCDRPYHLNLAECYDSPTVYRPQAAAAFKKRFFGAYRWAQLNLFLGVDIPAIKVKFQQAERISVSQNNYITEKLTGVNWRY